MQELYRICSSGYARHAAYSVTSSLCSQRWCHVHHSVTLTWRVRQVSWAERPMRPTGRPARCRGSTVIVVHKAQERRGWKTLAIARSNTEVEDREIARGDQRGAVTAPDGGQRPDITTPLPPRGTWETHPPRLVRLRVVPVERPVLPPERPVVPSMEPRRSGRRRVRGSSRGPA